MGGKGRLVSKILPLMPEHHIYVEPFGGGGAVLLNKPRSPIEVYNDLDSGLVTLFRVLRDPVKAARLAWLGAYTPRSREEYDNFKHTWQEPADDVEQALRWWYVSRCSFGGTWGKSWGFSVHAQGRGTSQACSAWLGAQDNLAHIHHRMMQVQIEHADYRRVIKTFDSPRTLFYFDPPYVMATRNAGACYRHEFTDADHRALVDQLLQLQGMAMLSGYPSALYLPLEEAGWVRHDWKLHCSAVGRTRVYMAKGAMVDQERPESLWVSPKAQAAPKLIIP